jgi:hypothetical protein
MFDAAFGSMQALVNDYPDYPVYVTGHSLGGAIASLMSYYMAASWAKANVTVPFTPIIYTFGQPRTGNYRYAEEITSLSAAIFRIVHYRDIVPHLPPCEVGENGYSCVPRAAIPADYTVLFGYHSQMEIWYPQEDMPKLQKLSSDPTYKVCSGKPFGEDDSCSNSLDYYDVGDHSIYFNTYFGEFCADKSTTPFTSPK